MNYKHKRILLISPIPPPTGGIASWTIRYLKWAKTRELCVEVVNIALSGRRIGGNNEKRDIFDEIFRTIRILNNLRTRIRFFKPNIVHLNTSCGKYGIIRDYLCGIIVKLNGLQLVVHYRCNIRDQIGARILQKLVLVKLSELADVNLVLNKSSSKYLDSISWKRSIILPNFIEAADIINEPKIINANVQNIVFIGNVDKEKGVKEILEVAKYFPEIKFTLIGKVLLEIEPSQQSENVIFMGPVGNDEVINHLRSADIFLFPTYTEGFSNALLEAMAAGLPIITTPVGANEDMIEKSGGVLVQVANIHDIVTAITLLKSEELRERMSAWNTSKVKSFYNINSVMEKIIKIYDELLGKKI